MQIIKRLAVAAAFVLCMALIIIGQMNKGTVWLLVMMVGLAGLLVLLYLYNRKDTQADRMAKASLKEAEKKQRQS